MFRLLGVEAITGGAPGGSDMAKADAEGRRRARRARAARPTSFPGGGSNALGGLGYVACAQELQQQWFELGLRLRPRRRRLGQLGHAWRPASPASSATTWRTPIVGIGVSRDPAEQEPLVHREAQAVLDLLGVT